MNIDQISEMDQELIVFGIITAAAKFDDIVAKKKKKLLIKYKKELIKEKNRYKNINLIKAFGNIIYSKKTQLSPIDLKFEYIIYARALCDLLRE
jgi:hypothetical protein